MWIMFLADTFHHFCNHSILMQEMFVKVWFSAGVSWVTARVNNLITLLIADRGIL